MLIEIEVNRFYDWELVDGKADDGVLTRQSAEGTTLQRIEVDHSSITSVNIPESEIADCSAYWERRGITKDRAQVVAWYLEEVVMPNHAPQNAWTAMRVQDSEEGVETSLCKRFGLKKLTNPTVAIPATSATPKTEDVIKGATSE